LGIPGWYYGHVPGTLVEKNRNQLEAVYSDGDIFSLAGLGAGG